VVVVSDQRGAQFQRGGRYHQVDSRRGLASGRKVGHETGEMLGGRERKRHDLESFDPVVSAKS
jgi:hypothetical protein